MKKIIVISTSLRHGSNSNMLAEKFIEGAKAAGNEVEKISLVGKSIQFCKGCMACQKLGRCVIKDDVNDIMAKVLRADVICWATPIYYAVLVVKGLIKDIVIVDLENLSFDGTSVDRVDDVLGESITAQARQHTNKNQFCFHWCYCFSCNCAISVPTGP